ncbi:hypothetical protein PRIPAC_87587, partial [Pristionchus pacificus]
RHAYSPDAIAARGNAHMEAEVEVVLRHLLVLCCNGGAPFVDFHEDIKHFGTRAVDPTDWSAEDIAGSSLLPNSTLLSSLPPSFSSLLSSGAVGLDSCDLFNLTFASSADQTIFERYGAAIACRCPLSHRGIACESSNHVLPPQALQSIDAPPEADVPSSMLIILCVLALSAFFFAFMMFRGCFCDCFGPFKWPGRQDEYDKDVDPEDIERSLAKVRAYEERQRCGANSLNEVHRPLVVPSVSSGCAAPYDQLPPLHSHHAPIHHPPPPPVPSAPSLPTPSPPPPSILHPPRPRASSPPPAYSSTDNLARQTTAI